MKEVKVRVEFTKTTQGSITSKTLPTGNNISNSGLLNEINGGVNCFVLGASKIGFDPFYNKRNKYSGFFSGILTGSKGESDVTITITGSNIDNFVINFENIAGQWATEIFVDNKKWTNTNPLFFWFGTKANSHTIRITKWNKPKYPIRMTSLVVGITIDFDKTLLIDAVRGNQSMADNSLPTYGVVSGYGNVTFVDRHKELLKLAELDLLKADLKIKFYYGDTKIGDYIAERWSYVYDSARATVTLTDSLMKWQDINFDGIDMVENKTAYDVYLALIAMTPDETFVLDNTAKMHLQSIKIRYLELTAGKLYEAWTKLCRLAELVVYKMEDGKVRVTKL